MIVSQIPINKRRRKMNLFDILGPVMVGPSSSHTAGAVRIGYVARHLLKDEPCKVKIGLYGSFAQTGKGHGTDRALIAYLICILTICGYLKVLKLLRRQV